MSEENKQGNNNGTDPKGGGGDWWEENWKTVVGVYLAVAAFTYFVWTDECEKPEMVVASQFNQDVRTACNEPSGKLTVAALWPIYWWNVLTD